MIANHRDLQGFEDKLAVKPISKVSLSSYLFRLNTLECVQFQTLWVGEKVRASVKKPNAAIRGRRYPLREGVA